MDPSLPPPGFRIVPLASGSRLVHEWKSPFGFLALGMSLVLAAVTLGVGRLFAGIDHPVVAFLPVPPALFALFTAYVGVLLRIEATEIDLAPGKLAVRHGPLPFPGKLDLDPGRIEHLEVRTIVTHRNAASSPSQGIASSSYDLVAHLRGGGEQRIVGGFHHEAEARWVEARVGELLAPGVEE